VARILYLDDEEALVFLVTRMLELLGHSAAGYTVQADVLAAIRSASERFDLVVTDLSMPGMNGFELAQEILAIAPGMAVAIVSGYVGPSDVETARAIGALDVIVKPHTIEDMSRAINGLLHQAAAVKMDDT
jgi:DNA-binding NtrC family response regulator